MMWFIKKEHISELKGLSSINEIFAKLSQLVKEEKAIQGAKIGKTTLGIEFNRKMMSDPNYETITFDLG